MFKAAKPCWAEGKEEEKNLRLQFKEMLKATEGKKYNVRIATSGVYQLHVGGKFAGYGPARAGGNHFRMDEIDITELVKTGENAIVIDVCGYNVNSYCMEKQDSFLQAEVLEDGIPVIWTGRNFTFRFHPYYIKKTQRYSFQRPMMESYSVDDTAAFSQNGNDRFLTDSTICGMEFPVETAEKQIIGRTVPYPEYEHIEAKHIFTGKVKNKQTDKYRRDRSWDQIGEMIQGFPIEELQVFPTEECQGMQFTDETAGVEALSAEMTEDSYSVWEFPVNSTGMLKFSISSESNVTLYVLFDELLSYSDEVHYVDFLRMDCANCARWDLPAGEFQLQMFQVYTMKYVQFVAACGAGCTVRNVAMTEYKHKHIEKPSPAVSENLKKIYDAGVETFRQNAVDIFTDCPSRERAGWLCDSFFEGRTEFFLTGENIVERAFLENFLHEDSYKCLPEGMLPMCYPADYTDGVYIPNWAMFFAAELEEHCVRTHDVAFGEKFREKMYRLLDYFRAYENESGLLENLPGWVFVEWSKANELTQGVSFPTNMMYYKALMSISRLYNDQKLAEKAEKLRSAIRNASVSEKSIFFHDNALRKDGILHLGEVTEVCQYYAFFTGVANIKEDRQLFETMMNEFGPDRNTAETYSEVYPAAPFIGDYLRLLIMEENGMHDAALENIEDYFLYMAQTTGTLWEKAESSASCCHGFASYVCTIIGR